MIVQNEINRHNQKKAPSKDGLDSTAQGICLQGNIKGRTTKRVSAELYLSMQFRVTLKLSGFKKIKGDNREGIIKVWERNHCSV